MNQKLQNIYDVIQQSEKLDAKLRDKLLKAVSDADKELEITAFKLERTEKVKKTTAILLEETIEELEQKRKAVEEQNRELEIESALEKVRTVAMGMRKPSDMLDVCKTISNQLHSLGVKEIRNVQTAIFYEQRGTYMNYEYYAKHDKTIITETSYTNHEMHKEFAAKMLKGKGETFITHIKGDEIIDWIAYQKTTNVFIDKYLETASSINYYWFSLGPVALGISTYHPLTEEEINLFKRFLKVFELAYKRYLDIEKAEVQAKEAQIEASLERVRAVAMSMHKSEDLISVCEVSFKEFLKLGFDQLRNTIIHIPNDEQKYFMDYDYSELTGGAITKIEYGSHPIVDEYLEKIRSTEDAYFEVVITADQLKGWKDFRKTSGQIDDPRLDNATALYYYMFSIGIGDIGISTFKPIDDTHLEILKRFRNVFDLAYRRYNDIALAEVQAREAQIEAALERVRSRTIAMHKSEELKEVIKVVLEQFVHLRINVEHSGFYIDYKTSDDMHIWLADPNIEPFYATFPYFDTPTWNSFLDAKAKGRNFYTDLLDFEEKNKFYRSLFKFFEVPEDARKFYLECNGLAVSTVLLDNVGLYIENFSGTPYTDEENKILMRFGKVFQQTYTRFLDLQKAEAQAKESQIQLALERVRARSLAMHHTSELQEVINTVAQQMQNMQININGGVFIAINAEIDNDLPIWGSAGVTSYVERTIVPFLDHPIFTKLRDSIKGKDGFIVEEYTREEKKEFFNHLFKHEPFRSASEERKKHLLSLENGYTRSISVSHYTSIFIINHDGKKFSEADNEVLKRFGKVFEQSYIRFLDIQKAEAQAREAQIEAALEKVRSRSLAMHNSQELNEVVLTLFDQMKGLNINIDGININILNDTLTGFDSWFTAPGYTKAIYLYTPYFKNPVMDDIFTAVRNKKDFLEKIYSKKDKDSYFSYLYKHTDYHNLPEERKKMILSAKDWCLAVSLTGNTGISIHSYTGNVFTPKDHEILKRFTKVFYQSYTRFLDLQKAEAQAREAKIEAALEKVRSRTMAMQKSEELAETAAVLFQQLNELGYIPDRITIGIVKEDIRSIELWSTDQIGNQITQIFKPSIDEPTTWSKIYASWKAKKKSVVINLSGKELNEWIRYVREEMHMFVNKEVLKENRRVHSVGFFSQGFIMMSTIEALPSEKIDLLERFAQVFNQTYTRFLDLQKVEAQAREAQIEAALERVRSRTLGMQHSDELADSAAVVFQQLINLGIEPNRIYIAIINDKNGNAEFWITDEDGSKVSRDLTVNLNENFSLKKMYGGWKEQKKSIKIDMQGEELEEYFSHLGQLNVPFKRGLLQKRRIQNIAYFAKGFIGVASPDETKPETIQLLERFAAVFNLTYTRFNDMKQAEAQNKIIQAENNRKTKELEDARQLQLSMLPKELPKLPHLDIAVYMKTATEVGGDYYDFNIDKNGTLTVLVGDATGHGMMSGMMVSIMKSFFISNKENIELKQFFENSNNSIKDMHLGRLMMPLMGVQITSDEIIATSAGMPPLIYFRNKSGKAGEFVINNLPLGGMKGIKYSLKKIKYEKGDTLLMMSDGFAELKNSQNEQYGYTRAKEKFRSIVQKSSREIIEELKNSALSWLNGKEPDDDVTFVVIKVN